MQSGEGKWDGNILFFSIIFNLKNFKLLDVKYITSYLKKQMRKED